MVLEANPSTTVTVLDRPEVIELSRRQITSPMIRWQSANFFEPWTLRADVVLLSRVLHDWDDADAVRILVRARETLSLGGRVFIIEMLIPEEGVAGGLCDLHLLIVTGGRERSVSHFELLLNKAGFKLSDVRTIDALPSIIVGTAS